MTDPVAARPFTRRTEKVSESLARQIVSDLARNGVEPGTHLPAEATMLSEYRVSRGSLREALRILEVQGLISIKPGPGGGPVVAKLTSRDFGRMSTMYFEMSGATFGELVEARLVMEPVIARLAAARRSPEAAEQLTTVLDEANHATLDDDPSYMRASMRFHQVVAGISGNRVLDLFGLSLEDIYTARVAGIVYPPLAREKVLHDHGSITKAILRGDQTKAERLMREHMLEFKQYVTERYPGLLDEVITWR
jgi:DNA-binding FadR family transcriptional regulator